MRKFRITGVDRDSGFETTAIIEARDANLAEMEALRRGIAVRSCEVVIEPNDMATRLDEAMANYRASMNPTQTLPAARAPVIIQPAPLPRRVVGQPICQACGGGMMPAVISEGNAAGIALAIIVLIIGCGLSTSVLGAVVGIPLIICALFMGGRRKKVWRCVQCRAIILRG